MWSLFHAGIKLNHVSKRGLRYIPILQRKGDTDLLDVNLYDILWSVHNFPCYVGIMYINGAMIAWWRHQMKIFSALLALLSVEFTGDRWIPLTKPSDARSFDAFFNLHLNKQLSKQSKRRWFETPSRSLWCHCNDNARSDPGGHG